MPKSTAKTRATKKRKAIGQSKAAKSNKLSAAAFMRQLLENKKMKMNEDQAADALKGAHPFAHHLTGGKPHPTNPRFSKFAGPRRRAA